MSRDYKLNKSELTRLKREEKLYSQYLPVLKLKQEQLQMEQNRIRKHIVQAENKRREALLNLAPYIELFSDSHEIPLAEVVQLERIDTISKSIAGINIKVFSSLTVRDIAIPGFHTAPWLIRSLPLIKTYLATEIEARYLNEEDRIIRRELRKATQKVNLFDMVLIPKTKEAIRRIRIALGDEQVAMVTRGKIAKSKKNIDAELPSYASAGADQ